MIKTQKFLSYSVFLSALAIFPAFMQAESEAENTDKQEHSIRVGVLSSRVEPGKNTSQGLYIDILREAGMEAKAVSAEEVQEGALDDLDIFIIGGGSGTKFSTMLGEKGGDQIEKFVQRGGGVLASCAGGYTLGRGHKDVHFNVQIANALCVDFEDRRWARGKGIVELETGNDKTPVVKMFYANGPLWRITDAPGFGVTKALAVFKTDIKKEGREGGIMPGKPAILGGTFGNGRFVLFSAHPEFYRKLGNRPLVVDAANWVVKGELQSGEEVNWQSVFPNAGKSPQVK